MAMTYLQHFESKVKVKKIESLKVKSNTLGNVSAFYNMTVIASITVIISATKAIWNMHLALFVSGRRGTHRDSKNRWSDLRPDSLLLNELIVKSTNVTWGLGFVMV